MPISRPFVMPEREWIALCRKQCKARRKAFPGTGDECERDGMCSECVVEAGQRVPAKYRTTIARASEFDALPGCEEL